MSKLFEYAIIYTPDDVTEEAKLLVEPTTVLAKSSNEVNIIASRAVPESFLAKLDQVEIAVRPF